MNNPTNRPTTPKPLRAIDAFASDPLLLDDASALFTGRLVRDEADLTLGGNAGYVRLQGFFDCDPRPTLVSDMGACFGPIVVARLLHAMKLVPGARETRTEAGAAVLASEGSVRRLGASGGRAQVRPGMVLIAGEGIDLGPRARLVCALAPGVTTAISGPARVMIRGHRSEARDRTRMVPFDLVFGTAAIDVPPQPGLRTNVPVWTPAGRFDLTHGRYVVFVTDDALVRVGAIGGGRVGVVNGVTDIADDLRDQMIQVPGFFAPVDGPHRMAHPERHRDVAAVLELLNAVGRTDRPRTDTGAEQALAPEPGASAPAQGAEASDYLARALAAARTVDRAGLDGASGREPSAAPAAGPQTAGPALRGRGADVVGFPGRGQAPAASLDPGFGVGFGFSNSAAPLDGPSRGPVPAGPDAFDDAFQRPARPRPPAGLYRDATGEGAGDLFHGDVAPLPNAPGAPAHDPGLYHAQPGDTDQRRVYVDTGAPELIDAWGEDDPAMRELAGIFAADLDRQGGDGGAVDLDGGSDFDPFLGDALGLSNDEFGFGRQGTLPPDRFFRAHRAFDGTPQDISGGRAVSGVAVFDCEDGFDGCEVHYVEDASRASATTTQRLARLDGVKARHMNPGNFVLKP